MITSVFNVKHNDKQYSLPKEINNYVKLWINKIKAKGLANH